MVERDFEPHHMEWWHFEHGTRAWAAARGIAPLFGAIGSEDLAGVSAPGR
jgi:hypothetical protein